MSENKRIYNADMAYRAKYVASKPGKACPANYANWYAAIMWMFNNSNLVHRYATFQKFTLENHKWRDYTYGCFAVSTADNRIHFNNNRGGGETCCAGVYM